MKMKRFLCVMLAISVLAFLIACQSVGTAYTAGTYIGVSESGMKGDVRVEVVFSSRAIISVRVIEHEETPSFAAVPVERIPRLIVEHQSLAIDAVAGATVTSFAILEAVQDAVRQANGNVDELFARSVPRVTSDEVVELQVEIVIVGAGAAGKTAAIFAAERGPGPVLLLEKMPGIGGNAVLSGGVMQHPTIDVNYRPLTSPSLTAQVERVLGRAPTNDLHARLLAQARADWESHRNNPATRDRLFDSLEFFVLMGLEPPPTAPPGALPGAPTQAAVDTAQRGVAFAQWLEDNGMTWQRPAVSIVGLPWPRLSRPVEGRLGEGFFTLFDNYIRRNNLQIDTRTETRATELIEENGRIVGVRARHISGRQYIIRSNRGVVLAIGGFSANRQMLEQYTVGWPRLTLTTNQPGATGDGIAMGLQVGARLANIGLLQMIPTGDALHGGLYTTVGMCGSGPYVNRDGVRFINEIFGRNDVSSAIFQQPDQKMFVISDANNSMIVDGRTEMGTSVEMLLRRGQLFTANTLEDLARQIGMPPAALANTINQYNQIVLGNAVCPFGRNLFPENAAILTPPFFASPRTPSAHITLGGLARDPVTWRAIRDADSQPIEGLYVIGEVTLGGGKTGAFTDGKELMMRIYPN